MEPPVYNLQTLSDLFNLANKTNFGALTEDLMSALYTHVYYKHLFKPLPKDWSLTWIDDGKVETSFHVKVESPF